ncbi:MULTISPECIES: T3SS effector HopA1 family protein [Cyanophyceae]|uniref:T3SS effector HopA1 family protein n=1 Tax=Cyanophyceae TaxID=3028117 RepID=UPI001683F25E|nr:T3SS effector HopA1 family protein [Trichocoleus sp. FACHB-40]MBD2002736.1 hypothetical protein [Trichocoleus sp. FACHB-40]
MQLLDSLPTQEGCATSNRILDALQDIIKVQIQSNFCILHPDYKPWELPSEVVTRFQGMPTEVQNRYISLQLRSFLYGIHYNGSLKTALANSDAKPLYQDLENNTVLGVDLAFYERLHDSNAGEGYFDLGWLVVRQESDGSLAVTKGGLTLHIKREQHLQPTEQSAAVGDSVAIRMPKNFVQNGFYMAVGNAGPESHQYPEGHPETVRVYFNLTTEGAVAVMASLTHLLNKISLPFTFKVLYNPTDYGRYDSGVLYFEKSNYEAVRQVLLTVYTQARVHFQPEIPLFTKLLAPGLGLAEEPDCKFAAQESFGMNRCQIVANGLLEAWHKGDDSSEGRISAVFQHFSLLGIDWQRSYLNANSENIYTPLNL